MAFGRRAATSRYETRCPRCDVSFPIETRKCLHCGGPTGQPAPTYFEEPPAVAEIEYGTSVPTSDEMYQDHHSNEPIEPTAESPFSIGESIEDTGFGRGSPNDRELETSDAPPSIVGSLIRSLGSFIWVILLIGFSLARGCED